MTLAAFLFCFIIASATVIPSYMQQHDKVKLQEIVELTGKSYASSKRYMRIVTVR